MRYIGRIAQLIVVGIIGLAIVPEAAHAGIITYEEALVDNRNFIPPLDFFRDLERTRTLGDGSAPQVEGDAAVIEAENFVGTSFGRQTADPVTYSHIFLPVGPVSGFQLASLEIVVGSVSGDPSSPLIPDFIELLLGLGDPNDPVEAEGNFLGFLSPTTPLATTTFEFATGDTALIDLLLADNRLDITITPLGPGFILEPEPDGDRISVRSSTLSVTYEVPEPATLGLLGAALFGVAAMGRPRRQPRLR